MTDSTHNGWPEKYRNPRDRLHLSVLRVTVESFDEMREATLDAAKRSQKQTTTVTNRLLPLFRSPQSASCARSSPSDGSNCSKRS